MHPDFAESMTSVHLKFHQLISMKPVTKKDIPTGRKVKGVYLFSERDEPLYAGRTNNLKQRVGNHCNASSAHNQAVFAFKLARHSTGRIDAEYSGEGRRAELVKEDLFAKAFNDSKVRVGNMQFRYVEENDQLLQALLEIYVASVLKTPYNDFDTH